MTAQIVMNSLGASHRLEIIRDTNGNGVVDSGEVIATGFTSAISATVTGTAAYYLRVASVLGGEFFSVGGYRLSYVTAGAVNPAPITSPI